MPTAPHENDHPPAPEPGHPPARADARRGGPSEGKPDAPGGRKPDDHPPDDQGGRPPDGKKEDSGPARAAKKAGPWKWVAAVVLLVAGGNWLFRTLSHGYHFQETDDAYVQGHLHQISPQIAGLVSEVLVDDNQSVRAGQTLVRITPLEFDIALQGAEGDLAQARAQEDQARAGVDQAAAQLAQAEAEILQAQAQVEQAGARLDTSERDFGRNARLYTADLRAVAKSKVEQTKGSFDADRAAWEASKANLAGGQARLKASRAQQESAAAQLATAQGKVISSESRVRDARRQLSYTVLAAPVDGRVGNKNVEAGIRVQGGQALLTLVQPDVWVVANFKETQLPLMRRGQEVTLTVDAIPKHDFTGQVDSIGPATGAQFSLLPPDNATGNFTKVVQRVPVKIVLDRAGTGGFEDRIRPGLSAVVNVRVR